METIFVYPPASRTLGNLIYSDDSYGYIIDNHYYKHHYYLGLINNSVKGALKNAEFDLVLANGLVRKMTGRDTQPGLARKNTF